jgi:hypothetical protein
MWGKVFDETHQSIRSVGDMTGVVSELQVAAQRPHKPPFEILASPVSASCTSIVLPQPALESAITFTVEWPQHANADLDIHIFHNGKQLCHHMEPEVRNQKGKVYARVTDASGRGLQGTTERCMFNPLLAPAGTYTFKVNCYQNRDEDRGSSTTGHHSNVDWHSSFLWGDTPHNSFNHDQQGQIASGATVDVLQLEVPAKLGWDLDEASTKWHLLEAFVKHQTSPLKDKGAGRIQCLPFARSSRSSLPFVVDPNAPELDTHERAVLLQGQLQEAEEKGFGWCNEANFVRSAIDRLKLPPANAQQAVQELSNSQQAGQYR